MNEKMQVKKKILILVDWYLPGYKGGGQIKAVEYIVENLKDQFDFHVLCRDHDADGVVYPGIVSNTWIERDGIRVKYLSAAQQPYRTSVCAEAALPQWDAVYANSFFSTYFSILPLLKRRFSGGVQRPFILAPRGEFSPGAFNLKRWKKSAFVAVSKMLGLHHQVLWHASTELEQADIRLQFEKAQVHIARELLPPAVQSQITPLEKVPGQLRLIFLSRISGKKGLDMALRTLAALDSGQVRLDIYGPIEDVRHWNECRALIDSMPAHITVQYCGELPHARIREVIPAYHFLFFPTLGENFGYVIIESLLAGRPVLISDQTPWRDLQSRQIGFDIPLAQPELFVQTLHTLIALDQAGFDAYQASVSAYASAYVASQDTLVKDSFTLFSRTLPA